MNDFGPFMMAITPELGLAGIAVACLGVACSGLRRSSNAFWGVLLVQTVWTGYAFLHMALFRLLVTQVGDGLLSFGVGSDFVCAGLMTISLILNWMTFHSRDMQDKLALEFPALVMAATVAFMILVRSCNLGLTFVALEAASLMGVALLAWGGREQATGALRYLMAAGLSAALMLWGVALVYAETGTLNYADLADALAHAGGWGISGVALILAGFAFKLGLFPFGYYLPAVYEKSTFPALGFLATLSKAAVVVALVAFLRGPAAPLGPLTVPTLSLIAVATLIWGALAALRQTNIKRLLALSGVVHAGFLTVGVVMALADAAFMNAVWFYLAAYMIAMLAILMALSVVPVADASIASLGGALKRSVWAGVALILGFASLAGLPPMGGFIAKFLLFFGAADVHAWLPLCVMLIVSGVALAYYFGVIRAVASPAEVPQERSPEAPASLNEPISTSTRVIIGTLLTALVLVGLFQGVLLK